MQAPLLIRFQSLGTDFKIGRGCEERSMAKTLQWRLGDTGHLVSAGCLVSVGTWDTLCDPWRVPSDRGILRPGVTTATSRLVYTSCILTF